MIGARSGAAAMQGARRNRVDPLETRILAEFAAVGWTVYGLFLARPDALTDVGGGEVSVWADLSGLGNNATQAVSADRPTYGATALGGGPGITFASDILVTPSISTVGHTAYAMMSLVQKATETATNYLAEIGDASGVFASGGGLLTSLGVLGNRTVWMQGRVSTNTRAQSADDKPTHDAPRRLTATFDTGLASSEGVIRYDGADVTATRSLDGNNATTNIAASTLTIGGRNDGSGRTSATLGAHILAAGAGPISGAALTAIANVEALLADALAAGSYA